MHFASFTKLPLDLPDLSMESAQKMAQVDSDLMGFQWDSNITYHHPDGPT